MDRTDTVITHTVIAFIAACFLLAGPVGQVVREVVN